MKKVVYLAVLTVFVLSSMLAVVACGGGTTETPPAPSPTPTPTGPDTTPSLPPPSGDKEADVVIKITEAGLSQEVVTIPVGGRVVWFNQSDRRWWISSPTKTPDTGVIPITQRMGYTFDEPGEYEYYDLYHREITGKVIVK